MRVLNQLSDMIYIVHWNCLYWLQYCYFTTFKITGVILRWKKIISKIGRGHRHFHYMLLCNDNISYRKHLGFLDGFVYMLPMSKIYCCIFYHCFYWKCNISEYEIVNFFTRPNQLLPERKKIVIFLIFHCWWLACIVSFTCTVYKAFFIVIDFN